MLKRDNGWNNNGTGSVKTKNPGVRDIARMAGVSTATVSRVLNTRKDVSEPTRHKVKDVIRALNYVPDATARALTVRKTSTIGAIVPTLDNAVYARGLAAAHRHLATKGYTMVLATSDYDPEVELRQAQNLLSRKVDGLILRGADHRPALVELLARQRVPWVSVGSYAPEHPFPTVGIDNRLAAQRAVAHLIELGHTRIGLIASRPLANDRARSRVEGVRAALAQNGIAFAESWYLESDVGLDDARQTARVFLSLADRPTGVVCTSDVIAFGVLIGSASSGVGVPNELSVVGIGDLEWSRHVQPALTTIFIPTDRIWTKASDFLVQTLSGNEFGRHFEYGVELIVRESTAPVGTK